MRSKICDDNATATMVVDKNEWREFHIHEGEDEYVTSLDLFGNLQEEASEEMMDFSYPLVTTTTTTTALIDITLKGFQDYTHSTGMAVWLGSEILARHLVKHTDLVQGKSVLELGSGLGLAGIICHRLQASMVVLTDGDTAVLNDFLKFNAAQNHDQEHNNVLETCQLIWGNQGYAPGSNENPLTQFRKEYGLFDVIISTDCTYMPQSLEPFWTTIDALLKRKNDKGESGIFLYVMEAATQAPLEDVLEMAQHLGFEWTLDTMPTIEAEPQDKDKMHDIYTFRRR